MILTCPQCATGYLVDAAQMRPGGRWVKCASCGARWFSQAPAPGAAAFEAGAAPTSVAASDPIAGQGEDISKTFRARVMTRRRTRQAAMRGAAWGAAAVALALVFGAGVVFRVDVVRVLPATAGLYAGLGLPVNSIGLVIEQVRAEPTLTLSHAALLVSGTIRNVDDHAVISPPLRIVLYNARGKRVAGQIAVPGNGRVDSGRSRRFAVTILDPPLTAYSLEVGFAPESARRLAAVQPARRAAPPPLPPAKLRGAVAAPNG